VGSKDGVDFCRCQDSNPESFSPERSRYTKYDTPAHYTFQ